MIGFIYKIRNILNNDFYLGSTATKLEKRKGEHFSALKGNYHFNSHLQNAWNLYGKGNFIFELCEKVDLSGFNNKNLVSEHLLSVELNRIKDLNPHYNICRETKGGKLGRIITDEYREKMRILSTGRNHTQESIKKIKEARAKQVITEKHKRKISEALKGRPGTMLGKKHSKEWKMLSSERLKENYLNSTGMFNVDAQRRRIDKMKEVYKSPEMREKFSKIFREKNKKPFLCFRKTGEFVEEFNNQIEAAEKLGFKKPWGISSVLTGIQKTHKGYTFQYKDN